jgi:hypothetical protein
VNEYRTNDEADADYEAKRRAAEAHRKRTTDEARADGVEPDDLRRAMGYLDHMVGAVAPHEPCPLCADAPDGKAQMWAARARTQEPPNESDLFRRGICLLCGQEPVDHLSFWHTDADGTAYGVCEEHRKVVVRGEEREAREFRRVKEWGSAVMAWSRGPKTRRFEPSGTCLLCGLEERPLVESMNDSDCLWHGVCVGCYERYLAGGGVPDPDGAPAEG